MQQVRVHSPATVANVVCGFDCLGFALKDPFDEMTLRMIPEKAVRIVNHDRYGLPTDPEQNVAGVTLLAMLATADAEFGFEVEINKQIKPGSGIGSSSASAAGAAVAANRFFGDRFSKLELVEFAMEGEKLASGAKHADNVAPCVFGGFTLIRSVDPLDVVCLASPPLYAAVLHPQIEVKTAEARAILPLNVPLRSAVKQWSNLGAFVSALATGDLGLLRRSMQDVIVEPVRRILIPHFDAVRDACLAAGALGGGISGSGPSMFMLAETAEIADLVRNAMEKSYAGTGIDFHTYVSTVGQQGVRFVD